MERLSRRYTLLGVTALGFAAKTTLALAQSSLPFPIVPAGDTALLEHQDRKLRLERLSNLEGIAPPSFYEYIIPRTKHKLSDYGDLPVLRVVYSDEVFFDFNQDQLRPESYAVLNTVAGSLRLEPPDVTVFIAGHTDAIGSVNYNMDLGLRRAKAVAIALARIGVNRAQIYLVSFGKAVPIASNDTDEGRAKNRRVEFLFAARPEPIAAWLTEQPVITCQPNDSAKGNDCPVDLKFPVQSVSFVTIEHAPKSIPVATPPSSIPQSTPTKNIAIGTKTIVIDLRQKTFTVPAPE